MTSFNQSSWISLSRIMMFVVASAIFLGCDQGSPVTMGSNRNYATTGEISIAKTLPAEVERDRRISQEKFPDDMQWYVRCSYYAGLNETRTPAELIAYCIEELAGPKRQELNQYMSESGGNPVAIEILVSRMQADQSFEPYTGVMIELSDLDVPDLDSKQLAARHFPVHPR